MVTLCLSLPRFQLFLIEIDDCGALELNSFEYAHQKARGAVQFVREMLFCVFVSNLFDLFLDPEDGGSRFRRKVDI
jgi:hypothetical protein